MKQFTLTFLILCYACSHSPAGDVPLNWMKPIQFEAEGDADEVLVAVPLDSDIYDHAQEDFADLRILDPEGIKVSYLIAKRSDTKTRMIVHRWMADTPSLSPADGKLSIEFELKKEDPFPERLEIVTPLRNFEQRIRVFGVGGENERLLADAVLFDYSRYMDVRRTEVALVEHQYRRFRVVIDDPTSEQESELLQLTRNLQGETETSREQRFTVERRPFRIERLQLISTTEKHVPDALLIQTWDNERWEIREDEDQGRTLIEFETRQPLSQLTLITGSRNFSRKVLLQYAEEHPTTTSWKTIATSTISRFKFGDLEEEQLTVKFPESRQQTYRLVIENRDSPPLMVDSLQIAGPQHQMLFLASPQGNYELHYGAETAELPDYDTAAIRHLRTQGVEPVVAVLGEQVALTEEPGQRAWTFQRLINNPFVLGSLIVIAVVVLGVSLYQAGKRIGQ